LEPVPASDGGFWGGPGGSVPVLLAAVVAVEPGADVSVTLVVAVLAVPSVVPPVPAAAVVSAPSGVVVVAVSSPLQAAGNDASMSITITMVNIAKIDRLRMGVPLMVDQN
jgi:hypothetical protein